MSLSHSLDLLTSIPKLLNESLAQLFSSVNNFMVKTYWEVRRLIVEDEQQGEKNEDVLFNLSNLVRSADRIELDTLSCFILDVQVFKFAKSAAL